MQRALWTQACLAATIRSEINEDIAASRDLSSTDRKIDEGWTVATTGMPKGDSRTSPCCLLTRNAGPITDCAAVAPSRTIRPGLTTSISASSHGLQARTCAAFGFSWRRRLPRRVERKGFTALVT